MTIRNHCLAFLLVVAGTTDVNAQSIVERANADELAYMQDDDPAMRKAFLSARASLDDFLEKLKDPPVGTTSYAVKVGIEEGKSTEYFWINEVVTDGNSFSGKINNEPRLVKSIRLGQTYRFSRARIVDWTYLDRTNRRMVGNFTACALLSKEPPAEADAMKKRFGLSCE